ncbi:NIPSNAP family protein [Nonomuraea sp. NEAU-A123]|uniref:NIPSNAP family protein n=1 Tax=Nonomuraea sp. NEAU-A123 TaxID=2839649 RepID=UPI001BE49DF9|nr:NIPSNAP family protein [Nonomuraea sp. NEAU-A123]MBT2226861.1 NIPSNAP family protein [Nonomuraea sp. NEAU-A123]
MIAELRFYTITPGHTPALFDQFAGTSLRLFAKHGITAYGPWLRRLTKGEQLVYMLEFEDEEDKARRWSAFREDPEWQKVVAAGEGQVPHVAGSEIVELSR